MGDTPASDRSRELGGRWSTLFQQNADPVFLLSARRQIRFVNHSWEQLTGRSAESVRGMFCLPRKKRGAQPLRLLLQAMAPPPEVLAGCTTTLRRTIPYADHGPPWWDITFIPLQDKDAPSHILGFIHSVEAGTPSTPGGGIPESLIALRQQAAKRGTLESVPATTPEMRRVVSQAHYAATTKAPLWIVGERGTGKETMARLIHFKGITREQTFLTVDCAGLQPFLIQSMLFGKAAQATAQLGTLFIKNPQFLSRDLQSELLEWFEISADPPRVIVAGHAATADDLREGRLLEEFHTTFNLLEIGLPPLRQRLADLPTWIAKLLSGETDGSEATPACSDGALRLLSQHTWPGNLRELRQTLRDALSQSNRQRIEASHLPLSFRVTPPKLPSKKPPPLGKILEEVEARMIRLALKKAKGNKAEAAEQLGIPRGTLLRRIEALKIET